MIKKYFTLLLSIISMLLLCSCISDTNRKTNIDFPTGYEVWRISSENIKLVKPYEEDNYERAAGVIEKPLELIQNNERYIFAVTMEGEYYIVDALQETVSDPMDESEFTESLSDIGIYGKINWINVKDLDFVR